MLLFTGALFHLCRGKEALIPLLAFLLGRRHMALLHFWECMEVFTFVFLNLAIDEMASIGLLNKIKEIKCSFT